LVCGIANPLPLKNYLHEHTHTYYQLTYSDHHIFSIEDLQEIIQKLEMELKKSIEDQNFEKSIEIRDQLKKLK
jgi:protein-arginine kinase activator protein McsA